MFSSLVRVNSLQIIIIIKLTLSSLYWVCWDSLSLFLSLSLRLSLSLFLSLSLRLSLSLPQTLSLRLSLSLSLRLSLTLSLSVWESSWEKEKESLSVWERVRERVSDWVRESDFSVGLDVNVHSFIIFYNKKNEIMEIRRKQMYILSSYFILYSIISVIL
jgi:hypothetical protein